MASVEADAALDLEGIDLTPQYTIVLNVPSDIATVPAIVDGLRRAINDGDSGDITIERDDKKLSVRFTCKDYVKCNYHLYIAGKVHGGGTMGFEDGMSVDIVVDPIHFFERVLADYD